MRYGHDCDGEIVFVSEEIRTKKTPETELGIKENLNFGRKWNKF